MASFKGFREGHLDSGANLSLLKADGEKVFRPLD